MNVTLQQLAEKLGLDFSGDGTIELDHVCGIESLKTGGLSYITNPKEMANLPTPPGIFDSKKMNVEEMTIPEGSVIVVPQSISSSNRNFLYSNDPMLDHARAIDIIYGKAKTEGEIHPQAVISDNVFLGKGVTIDANVVIYEGVNIGDNTVVKAGTVVMENCVIGNDCLIYPNVTIREGVEIGSRVILHSGAVIGADGYGFFQREGINKKVPQVGTVLIEDDVEIGACSTIDRARFTKTILRKGCKLDNLVHIAHNVEVGEHSLITAQSGVAGSTTIGHHLMMGGQSGIKDNLKIGNHVTLLARTLVTSRVDDHSTVAGMPSRPIEVWRKIQALINSLDRLFERIKQLEKKTKSLG